MGTKQRYENRLKYGGFEGLIAMHKNTIERLVKFVKGDENLKAFPLRCHC